MMVADMNRLEQAARVSMSGFQDAERRRRRDRRIFRSASARSRFWRPWP